mmetsp:Transcript_48921/g.98432  ORF Transcript_48921/g.98432 Transcript_48921/m.98432 type:complete len:275 (+) Transcript_48921:79-903(+)
MIVTPGEVITRDNGLLRGHGILSGSDSSLISSTAGVVDRVNKLVSVKPLKRRYCGEVGDIVVGRVTEVGSKRWKIDVQGHKDAVLHLSSVNLPGGEQRMRNYDDQLSMRTFFAEGDLVSAEVQGMQSDGSASLHTRSLKYGKLENGQVFSAPACLVARLKNHALILPDCGVELILGNNGLIWITRARPEILTADAEVETHEEGATQHATTATLPDERLRIARVRNALSALCSVSATITPESIMHIYRSSEKLGLPPKALLETHLVLELLGMDKE